MLYAGKKEYIHSGVNTGFLKNDDESYALNRQVNSEFSEYGIYCRHH
jgi:hypothetical protein